MIGTDAVGGEGAATETTTRLTCSVTLRFVRLSLREKANGNMPASNLPRSHLWTNDLRPWGRLTPTSSFRALSSMCSAKLSET